MTNSAPPCSRELAERSSSGTHVRLLWRQGTRRLWVEVREQDEWVLAFPVRAEQALDAFRHPYAYAGSQFGLSNDCPLIPECGEQTEEP